MGSPGASGMASRQSEACCAAWCGAAGHRARSAPPGCLSPSAHLFGSFEQRLDLTLHQHHLVRTKHSARQNVAVVAIEIEVEQSAHAMSTASDVPVLAGSENNPFR